MLKRGSIQTVVGAILVALLPLIPQESQAFRSDSPCLSICIGEQSRFGETASLTAQLPAQFRLVIWNVYKGGYWGSDQESELKVLLKDAHIALIQEAIGHPDYTQMLRSASRGFHWILAHAFTRFDGYPTGVATGTNAFPLKSEVLLSPVFEPVTFTPKSVMITKHLLEGAREPLLVINVHGINFVSTSSYRKHVDQIVSAARHHHGPLILGGDFNTWNESRMEYLLQQAAQLGLAQVPVELTSYLQVDHLFVRGLNVLSAQELNWFQSSDHWPLAFDLAVGE